MPRLADHTVQFGVFVALFAVATVLGFTAAGWRRPDTPPDLEQWGLGGRAFGNWVTWFLVGGDVYTAYTFVAVPALVYAAGAYGYFAVPFAVVTYPLIYLPLSRLWSVAHTHGFITPAELVRARFGSRGLGAAVALRRRWLEHRLRAIKLLTVQTKDPDALKELQRENFNLAKALSELRV